MKICIIFQKKIYKNIIFLAFKALTAFIINKVIII